ncbi:MULTISPECIES: cupin domain-containing protein [Eubacterium]|uniref:Ethanolamine utilization protein EutQ n=1 Tax=Eubacterium barkeri TaxID=1528 RepID=A0A1H3I025_EUBBA|nr:cupin domain-containing protein [Eubacterium barkeri]SDY21061.1 ethanolamine utilization protein EutQ [Eubacterium barkeri]
MNLSEALIKQIVESVLKEQFNPSIAPFQKDQDPSGIIKVKTDTVRCEPFGETLGVGLRDILSLEEAPRMGAGIMELDNTRFEWTLTYDEYDMVIDGELEIEIDGRTISGGPGDILYIPKGSHIFFKTPSKARYAYFVYPANWQE